MDILQLDLEAMAFLPGVVEHVEVVQVPVRCAGLDGWGLGQHHRE